MKMMLMNPPMLELMKSPMMIRNTIQRLPRAILVTVKVIIVSHLYSIR